MPAQTKISRLPAELRNWLEGELKNNRTDYSALADELNAKLAGTQSGEIGREAVRRHGAKVAAAALFRDELVENIRQELDPDRTIPPVAWNRAVVSAMGQLNYRAMVDLQCQETVTVREHGAFVRTLLRTHEYEKQLAVEPLTFEEVREFAPAMPSVIPAPPPQPESDTATVSFRPEPEGRSGGIFSEPAGETPPLRAAPSGRGDTDGVQHGSARFCTEPSFAKATEGGPSLGVACGIAPVPHPPAAPPHGTARGEGGRTPGP